VKRECDAFTTKTEDAKKRKEIQVAFVKRTAE